MSEESYSKGDTVDLLHELEDILESDPLIDEVGFIHPSQLLALYEGSGISTSSSDKAMHQSGGRSFADTSNQENIYFWNRDHKLGISTHVLLPLYKAAKQEFMIAFKQFKTLGSQSDKVGDSSLVFESSYDCLEIILMRHSRSLLLLSCDFMTAWNCRKLVVLKKNQLSMFIDELHLSALVLSYSPKSEQAWNHRRWVIKSISGNSSNFREILEKESELVEKLAERSKMNYRAWNHRCWLISYMKREQVFRELKKSRSWAALHVADSSCFHYRRQLLLKILEDSSCMEETVSSGYNVEIDQVWKDELDWNKTMTKRYVGREALWLHRRFLSVCWSNNILRGSSDASYNSKEKISMKHCWDTFLEDEISLLSSCLTIVDDEFEDFHAQATYSASYILWLKMQVPEFLGIELQEKLREFDLKALLNKSYPQRSSLSV
ncbi:hypothetical protein L6164_006951 [Bauhinia variegata]|uniref:Uncharacterized protein n=1 Tax=Bauhinia variegata TaxID=167791 RepID=A0ACB9Q1G8_BAUVA|nr:hypothetical protein L6164_006951 [Bauhinia variegata]